MGPPKYPLCSSLLLRAVPWLTRVGSGPISSKVPGDLDPTNPIGKHGVVHVSTRRPGPHIGLNLMTPSALKR